MARVMTTEQVAEHQERMRRYRVQVHGPLSETVPIAPPLPEPKPSKYANVQTDGKASRREAIRAAELGLLAKIGQIRELREQVSYTLVPRQLNPDGTVGERAVAYVADFVYVDTRTGETVVEDCKGFPTPDYIIKRKLMRFVHRIIVVET